MKKILIGMLISSATLINAIEDDFLDEEFNYLISEDFNEVNSENYSNLSTEDFNLLNDEMATLNEASSKWQEFKNKTFEVQATLPGWCSKGKAEKLMDMVATIKPAVWVEIGVFGGSSLYPVAQALKYFNCGVAYAVDSWTGEACAAGYSDKNNSHAVWWKSLNLQDFYNQFRSLILKSNLYRYCNIIKSTSSEAVAQFEDNSISVLFTDGNHSEPESTADVVNWLPKVAPGGYIWLNAANWPTVQNAVEFLKTNCEIDEEMSVGESCLCFRKP